MSMKAPRLLLTASLIGLVAAGAAAFTLEPMSALLAPSGAGSVATFRVKNDGAERVALRFRVLSRAIGADGREENAPAEGLFVVYPSRLVVEAGASAAVKLQWKGPAAADAERCFRFVAEQVPIDAAGPRGSGLKIMFRYVASLYVGEASFSPELKASATGAAGPDGKSGYLVEIRNEGKRHVIASEARIRIPESGAEPLSGAELGGLSGANYLPSSSRSAFVPRPEAIQGKTYVVELEYEAVY